jgi:hypothetical protein
MLIKPNIKQVYCTTDGKTFDVLEEANSHQHKVDAWEAVKVKFGSYGTVQLNYLEDFLAVINYYEENKDEN